MRLISPRPTRAGAALSGSAEVNQALGISRQHLYDILRERKPVSAEVAVRLGAAFGDGPDVWLRMQAAYDAWHALRTVDVSKVPRLADAVQAVRR